MKKFYRGNIPNYKMDNGWTSPINTKSKEVSDHLDLVDKMPPIIPFKELKSPTYSSKIQY